MTGYARKFEVIDIPGKGYGMVAREDIGKGETVLEDTVLLNARVGGGTNFHNRSFLNRQVALLSTPDREEFLSLNDPHPDGPAELRNERIYVNNTFLDGCYLQSARMNHSCQPNVMLSSDDTIHAEIIALVDIAAGQEILVSYLRTSDLETKDERKRKIENWNFECNCVLCCLEVEKQQMNDQQREKVRNILNQIDQFFDQVWRTSTLSAEYVRPLINSLFDQAKECQTILSTELEGQSTAALILTYLKLAELVAFSQCGKYQTTLLNCEKDTTDMYMDMAKEEAKLMGQMFLSNCKITEREIEELHEEFR